MDKKRDVFVIFGLLILIFSVFFVSAAVNKTKGWEPAEDILVNIQIPNLHSVGGVQTNFGANLQQTMTSGVTGWYDNNTNQLLSYANCTGCQAVCGACGTRSESWSVNSSVNGCVRGGMIVYDNCCGGIGPLGDPLIPFYHPVCKGLDSGITSLNRLAPTHNASQIWVSTKYGEKTLLSALQSASWDKLCPANPIQPYSSHPDSSQAYHFATEIEVNTSSTIMSLQDAIDKGFFCYQWTFGNFGSCSQTCGNGTQTRTVTCKNFVGTTVADSNCEQMSPKPSTNQICNPQPCTWQRGSSYGCGSSGHYAYGCPSIGSTCTPYGTAYTCIGGCSLACTCTDIFCQ